jgi:hypothetical protein
MVTPLVTVFLQGLSGLATAARELLGGASFAGIAASDRLSAYNHLPLEQRQLCLAHLIRHLTAMAERQGASDEIGTALVDPKQQLFERWRQWGDGTIAWPQLR